MVLKTLAKVFLSLLLIVSLTSFLLALSFTQLTEQERLEQAFVPFFKESISERLNESVFEKVREALLVRCERERTETIVVSGDTENFTLTCSFIETATLEEFVEESAKLTFESAYKKEYPCTFLDCLREGRLEVLFSQKANLFFSGIWPLFLAAAAIFTALLTLVSLPAPWVSLGIPFVVAGLPAFFLALLKGTFKGRVPTELFPLLENMLTTLKSNFIVVFVLGCVLIAGGIALAFVKRKKRKPK